MLNEKKKNNATIGISDCKVEISAYSDVGLALCRLNHGSDFDDLKKAIAYIPGCIGEDYLQIIACYLSNVAIEAGYAINNLLVWEDVFHQHLSYTEDEEQELQMNATNAISGWYNSGKANQIEAIFYFTEHLDASLTGFYDLGGSEYFSLGCFLHPDNKKAIYKPNSNELKPGVIPGYWVGTDENFLGWLSSISGYRFEFV